jgi:hypothetical protein
MSDPIGEVKDLISSPLNQLRAGVDGAKEVIAIAEDMEGVVRQVQQLNEKTIAARTAWRKKKVQVKGDYAFVDAVDEYTRVKEAQKMREELKKEVIRKWGESGWAEVEVIEERQKEDLKKIYTEEGHDRDKLRRFTMIYWSLSFILVGYLWVAGYIRQWSMVVFPE